MDKQKIDERMKERHITDKMMIVELGMHSSTYYRKWKNNGEGFSALDLNVFKRVLGLNEHESVEFLLS